MNRSQVVRHGILMQSEIPAWGYDTFAGIGAEPDADILQNALEQLREMIARPEPPLSSVLGSLQRDWRAESSRTSICETYAGGGEEAGS